MKLSYMYISFDLHSYTILIYHTDLLQIEQATYIAGVIDASFKLQGEL